MTVTVPKTTIWSSCRSRYIIFLITTLDSKTIPRYFIALFLNTCLNPACPNCRAKACINPAQQQSTGICSNASIYIPSSIRTQNLGQRASTKKCLSTIKENEKTTLCNMVEKSRCHVVAKMF